MQIHLVSIGLASGSGAAMSSVSITATAASGMISGGASSSAASLAGLTGGTEDGEQLLTALQVPPSPT